jgi:hypothetical protein
MPYGLKASSKVVKVLYRLAIYLIYPVLLLPEAPSALFPVSTLTGWLLSRITG